MNVYVKANAEKEEMAKRYVAIVALATGVLMVGQWLFFLGAGQVPELATAPAEIAFHLAAELLTALALIAAGVGLFLRRQRAAPAALVAFGMLLYTVINSAGYFAQRAEWPPVMMFVVLLVLALACISRLAKPLL